MVDAEDLAHDLRARIDSHFEWLLVRENGRAFPLRRTEIDVRFEINKTLFGVFDDSGFDVSRIRSFTFDENELLIDLSSAFGARTETVRLIPRTSARELSQTIELARLERANLIGAAIAEAFPTYKILRIALHAENGRIAQIFVRNDSGKDVAVMSDVTATMIHEAVMSTAILWSEKLKLRKHPINEVWIAVEKKQARNLQRLFAMLDRNVSARFRLFEISNEAERPKLKELRKRTLKSLWSEKATKLSLPADVRPSETAEKILAMSPANTDIIFSRQGETVRFNGLPFARIRTMADRETAWFGIDRRRQLLTDTSFDDLAELVAELEHYRSAAAPNTRHEYYRAAPEAWLESILRRNIQLLDANLILSPIYNQFRASSDKIDLLAIRRDGRLVIIELKTSPDREMVFQAADYWRKIELQRRRGDLARARAFGDMEILDKPALVYAVAPALSFHLDFALFAKTLAPEIEFWRFELHETWRGAVRVLGRRSILEKS